MSREMPTLTQDPHFVGAGSPRPCSSSRQRFQGGETPPLHCALVLLLLLVPHLAKDDDQLHLLTTRHYRIHTDMDQTLAEEIARRMDTMYDEYTRRLVEFRPPTNTPMLEVYL